MVARKYTDEELVAAVEDHGSQDKAAKALGINRRTLERRLANMRRRGWSPEHDIKNPVPDGFHLKGASTLYGPDGEQKLQWIKSSIDHERQAEIMEEIVRSMMRDIPARKTPKLSSYPDEDLLTSYPIVDSHIGMLAWGREVGTDWDMSIASDRMIKAFQHLVANSPASGQCIIENLGDYFHAENMEGVTNRSRNPLDMDSRFGKMIDIGVDVIVAMIDEALKRHETVHLANLRGNHDETASIVMNSCLAKMYSKDKRVIVDPSPSVFKYHRFGKVMIGMHHGHTTKMTALPGVMAMDRAKDWGDTIHRYWHTGHIHHKTLKGKEENGCYVESFRTLIPGDSHSHDHGYRSMSDATAIIYHKEFGEITRHYANAAMIAAMEKRV